MKINPAFCQAIQESKPSLQFKMISTDDPNVVYDLDATELKTAAIEALSRLGWRISVASGVNHNA